MISISLFVNLTWVNPDRFVEDLVIEVWNRVNGAFEFLQKNGGGTFPLGPQHLYWNDVRLSYCIDVRLSDSASVAKEKKGKVSVDILYAAIVAGDPDTTPPQAPSNLLAGQISESGVELTAQLTWTSSDPLDVACYRIYRGGIVVGASTVCSFADPVTSASTYTYVVSAVDAAGNESAPSATASVVLENLYPPSIPSSLTAAAGDGQVILSWSPNSEIDLDGYNVYGWTEGGDPVLLNDEPCSGSSYPDGDLANGTTYFYAVEAVDTGGRASGLSAQVSATPSALPVLLANTDGSLTAAGKNWKAVATVSVK